MYSKFNNGITTHHFFVAGAPVTCESIRSPLDRPLGDNLLFDNRGALFPLDSGHLLHDDEVHLLAALDKSPDAFLSPSICIWFLSKMSKSEMSALE
jgi:hypothetical protein